MSEIAARLAAGGPPLIVAHRGDWSHAPENSLAAIYAARAFDMVEIDVRLTSDGVPVVMHDESCLRTTGHDVTVASATADEVTTIPFPDSNETVPSLADALAAGAPDLLFDLDVKSAADLNSVAEFMASRPERDRCMLKVDVNTSADIDDLLALQAQADTCVIAKHILMPDAGLSLLQEMKQKGVPAVEVWFSDLDILRRTVEVAPPVTTYTLKDVHCAGLSDEVALDAPDRVWGTLMDTGLRAIMTDEPAALATYRDQKAGASEMTTAS